MEIFSSYSGGDFLAFYALMLGTCVFAGIWLPAFLRPPGVRGKVTEVEELAVLTGGAERHATAILSQLFAQGALDSADKDKLRVAGSVTSAGPAEKEVLSKVGDFRLSEVKSALKRHAETAEARLIRRGLIMDAGELWRLRMLAAAPYAVVFVIGLYRQQAGAAQGEPTGFLVALLGLTIVFALIRMGTMNSRTMAGNEAIRELEKQSSRLKRAPQAAEAGFAVALFGTAVLVGTPWEPLHAMRQAASGDSGSSGGDSGSSGDSDGGSGCGGGGCGGCGG
jgi:uncharacterized protein (TIGR04222 family)